MMLKNLIAFIRSQDGINDKTALTRLAAEKFELTRDRSVYYSKQFALRFCKANSFSFSNTVLSLSALQKYDTIPVIVCVVTPSENHLLLANSTFLAKISHSSKELRCNNIRGSFNGSDILRQIDNIKNEPKNFEVLFAIHRNFTFEENLIRLVEATNNIVPTGTRFDAAVFGRLDKILQAPYNTLGAPPRTLLKGLGPLRIPFNQRFLRYFNFRPFFNSLCSAFCAHRRGDGPCLSVLSIFTAFRPR
jgi:hypothetical protein